MNHVRNIVQYVVLFLCNGVMLWYFRGYFNLLIAVGMIVLALYAVLSVHIVKRYVSVELDAPAEYVPKGTEFFMRIRLHNRSFLPLVQSRLILSVGNTFVGEKVRNDLIVPMRMSGTTEAVYPLASSYVGNIEFQVEKLVLYDLLGFHAVTLAVGKSGNVSIIPSGGSGEEFSLNDYEKGMDEVEESRLSGSDFSDVSQIREYIPGDAIKNIHWKLSAKKEQFMVKERLHMSSRKLLVVLSLDKGDAAQMDAAVETLDSFGSYFIENRVPVTLFWWSGRFHEMRNQTSESAEEWLRQMILLFRTQAENGFVEEHFKTIYPGRGYVLIRNGEILVR